MAVLPGPAGRHGGGSAHCYLPFPREKGIQGLLTSGFSQRTPSQFPSLPLANLAGGVLGIVLGGLHQEPSPIFSLCSQNC